MTLLRRVLLIGVVATLLDVGGTIWLATALGWPLAAADAVAVAVATLVSFGLHTGVTPQGSPGRRWFASPGPYWSTAAVALVVDVAVLVVIDMVFGPTAWWTLGAAKTCSLAAAFLVRSNGYRDLMFTRLRDTQGTPASRGPLEGGPRLSVVVPAYREVDRIASTIAAIRGDLSAALGSGGELEIVVVDDGSGDGTAEEARRGGADVVVAYETNRGKGAAVREGMLAANGRTIAFTDADLAYPPLQIVGLLEEVERGWDVVVGSRQHTNTMTVVRAGRLRESGGRIVNVLTGVVLLGRYRDTQCGLKAFRRDVARTIFSQTLVDGFAMDVEVFHLVERYDLSLTEVPVDVVNSDRSTVNVVRDAAILVRDLFRIRSWSRRGLYGDGVMPDAANRD